MHSPLNCIGYLNTLLLLCGKWGTVIFNGCSPSDCMNSVVDGLTIKRAKSTVVDQLLELGLIDEDSKFKKKSRSSKSGGGEGRKKRESRNVWENTGRADDFIESSGSSSDDDIIRGGGRPDDDGGIFYDNTLFCY